MLIRAIFPVEGLERMGSLGRRFLAALLAEWTCQADAGARNRWKLNRIDSFEVSGLYIERGSTFFAEALQNYPRVGINSVPEPWLSIFLALAARPGLRAPDFGAATPRN